MFVFRFDVAGVHPDNKRPGGYTQVPYFIGTGVSHLLQVVDLLLLFSNEQFT